MDKPTQKQMFYRAQKEAAEVDKTFLEIVAGGLTREELEKNIERRPALWARFSSWLDFLPSRGPTVN